MPKANYMRIIKYLSIAILFASCEKDVTVKVPAHKASLVVNSLTIEGDTIEVEISKTTGILEKKGKAQLVDNAIVSLYADNKFVETLLLDKAAGMYRSNTLAEQGKTYKIEAAAPSFNTVNANSIMPDVVDILEINKVSNARTNIDGIQQDELTIKFIDPAAQGDYYILQINPVNSYDTLRDLYYEPTICVNTNDPSVESINNEPLGQDDCMDGQAVFINDVLFNGRTKELKIYLDNVYTQPIRYADGSIEYPTINLIHVTEAGYKYMRSYKYAANNADNPFSEPSNVYTNVKNGYGIFTMMSISTKEVK